MKKAYTLVAFVTLATCLIAVSLYRPKKVKPELPKWCNGYTIIEAGKGINCHGDTIDLEQTKTGWKQKFKD